MQNAKTKRSSIEDEGNRKNVKKHDFAFFLHVFFAKIAKFVKSCVSSIAVNQNQVIVVKFVTPITGSMQKLENSQSLMYCRKQQKHTKT